MKPAHPVVAGFPLRSPSACSRAAGRDFVSKVSRPQSQVRFPAVITLKINDAAFTGEGNTRSSRAAQVGWRRRQNCPPRQFLASTRAVACAQIFCWESHLAANPDRQPPNNRLHGQYKARQLGVAAGRPSRRCPRSERGCVSCPRRSGATNSSGTPTIVRWIGGQSAFCYGIAADLKGVAGILPPAPGQGEIDKFTCTGVEHRGV